MPLAKAQTFGCQLRWSCRWWRSSPKLKQQASRAGSDFYEITCGVKSMFSLLALRSPAVPQYPEPPCGPHGEFPCPWEQLQACRTDTWRAV